MRIRVVRRRVGTLAGGLATALTLTACGWFGGNGGGTTYTLAIAGAHGTVSVNGTAQTLPYSHSFASGAKVALEAVPDGGYGFGGWTGDLTGSANPTSVTMDADKSATANFTPSKPVIQAFTASPPGLSSSGGSVTLSWSAQYASSYSVSVSPGVSGFPKTTTGTSVGATLPANAGSSGITYTFTLTATGSGGSASKTLPVTVPAASQVTLSLSGSHGRVRVNGTAQTLPYSHAFAIGASVALEAVPDTGYQFDGWGGDLTGSANPASVTMDADKSVSVSFTPLVYSLSLSGSHGRVSVNGTDQSLPYSHGFASGANVTLEAIPDSGYQFDRWSGDLTGSANPASVTMDADKSIGVAFSLIPNPVWNFSAVDCTGSPGATSLALDNGGTPHIAYYDAAAGAVRYASLDGATWDVDTVDDVASVGQGSVSLALDAAGQPHVAYYDSADGDLRYATFHGSAWVVEVVDSAGDVGAGPSLALGSDGQPSVSYLDTTNSTLKYAWYDGADWSSVGVDSSQYARRTSLAFDSGGRAHVGYYASGDLRYATFDGSSWSTEVVSIGNNGWDPALALDSGGVPYITYYDLRNEDLRYATRGAGGWAIGVVDKTSEVGYGSSLAFDGLDRPHVAYNDPTRGNLKYASRMGATWSTEIVDGEDWAGWGASLALDGNGDPRISYTKSPPDAKCLMYAWWGVPGSPSPTTIGR